MSGNWKSFSASKAVLVLLFPALLRAEADPLLNGPWISDMQRAEGHFYHRMSGALLNNQGFIIQLDNFGRKYKVHHDGRIEFIVDRDYRFRLPDSEQLNIHLSEAEELIKQGNIHLAFLLLNGMGQCSRLNNRNDDNYHKSSALLSRLTDKYSHQKTELDLYTDPYACYFTGIKSPKALYVESAQFPYKMKLPGTLQYYYPDNPLLVSGVTSSYAWKISRFYYSPAAEKAEDVWPDPFVRETYNRPDRIILTIGTSYHYLPEIHDSKNYFMLWDILRGITEGRKKLIEFKRNKGQTGYDSSYSYIDEKGKKRVIYMNEQYYLRGNRGILLMLSYPEKYLQNGKNLWNEIIPGVIIK